MNFNTILKPIISAVRRVSDSLGPKDDWIEAARRYTLVALDPIFRPLGRPLITEQAAADYIVTASAPADRIEVVLDNSGYQRNSAATRKYLRRDGERDWSEGSYVFDPPDTDWQHHVDLYATGNDTTDIYGHREKSAEHDPHGHVTDEQIHGDPYGRVPAALNHHKITYTNASD